MFVGEKSLAQIKNAFAKNLNQTAKQVLSATFLRERYLASGADIGHVATRVCCSLRKRSGPRCCCCRRRASRTQRRSERQSALP